MASGISKPWAEDDPRRKGWANLIPSKPGEIRNPKGINQYTYKREFEKALDEAFSATDESGTPVIVEFARSVVKKAKAGDKHMVTEALARVWPVIRKIEGEHNVNAHVEVERIIPLENLTEEKREQFKQLVSEAMRSKSVDE